MREREGIDDVLGGEKKEKMKTKKVVLMEIAIVLCLVLLVALPAIAAEQNQEMQKVSASASTITTASECDFVLGIYGNANEDDTIDMRDVTYIKLVIFGKKPETEFCDANYDGRVSMLDVVQTKLIIVGKEGKITIVDSVGRNVTIDKPVRRIVVLTYPVAEAVKIVKAERGVCGISRDIRERKTFFPELSKLPSVGEASNPDIEKILQLNPNAVFTGRLLGISDGLEERLPAAIALVRWDMGRLEMMTNNIKKLGYILDAEEEAEAFCNFYRNYIDGIVKARVAKIPDDEKKRVFIEHFRDYYTFLKGSAGHEVCEAAGGINIAAELPQMTERPIVEIDTEWLVGENPDVIVKTVSCKPGLCGYETDDPKELKKLREELMNRNGWKVITAVTTGQVYLIDHDLVGSTANFIGAIYMAKWFYPELFKDIDPKVIHQEYLTRFQRLDYNLDEHGVFVYPPLTEGV